MSVMNREKIIEDGKYYYPVCKCGVVKENYRTSYCKTCMANYTVKIRDRRNSVQEKINFEELNNFVERMYKQNKMASMKDLFVDLITLHNYFMRNRRDIDCMNVGLQLALMWEDIEKLYWKKKKLYSRPSKRKKSKVEN